MKNIRFLTDCLDERASLLLENGEFVVIKIKGKKRIALYELYRRPVEVVVENKDIQSIEFIHTSDTERLASFISRQEVEYLWKKLVT